MNGKVAVAQRGAIVSGIHAGRTNSEIAGFNSIPISTVKKISKLYNDFLASEGMEEDFDIQRKAHRRRSDNMREDMVEVIEDMVDVDPGVSMRAIARELGCSEKLVRKICTQDLRYKSYRLCKGQFMNQATKERRLVKAKALLNRFKHPPSPKILIFYSDEKNFNQDQKVNSQNNRWLCEDPEEVPIVMKTKFPAQVMVLGVVSNEGDVMPPHVFAQGLKINTEVYIDVLSNVVKPWMDGVARGRPYVWQQDGAPAHNANRTQDWCRANLPHFWEKEVWPPSSPDVNPLDFYVWGALCFIIGDIWKQLFKASISKISA